MQTKSGVTELVCEINWIKCKFSAILMRHCCHSNKRKQLYLSTVLNDLKFIQCITLVSFFSEISIGCFWDWNLYFFTFQEIVGIHLNVNISFFDYQYLRKRLCNFGGILVAGSWKWWSQIWKGPSLLKCLWN